jgi:hypothetical protein
MACEPAARGQYLVEIFTSGHSLERLRADAARVRVATGALAAAGEPIRYLDSLLLPDEETGFLRFEADGADAVERVLREVGLEAERISPAIAVTETATALARQERR